MKDALIKALRSASNAVAGNVAGPVDLISMGLRGVGVPVPQNAIGGSDWMRQRGLLSDVPMGPERIVGETLGLLGPTVIAQKAPQIARGLLQGAENLAAPRTLNPQTGAIVWHGSPHKFDRFDSSKIGTGEGAQAYGHGLYLAESPKVAKSYASLGEVVSIDGKTVHKGRGAVSPNTGDKFGVSDTALNYLGINNWDIAKTQKELTKSLKESTTIGEKNYYLERLSEIKKLRNSQVNIDPGSLYKVDLPDAAIARMLDWDKPLSQQAPEVQKAVENIKASLTGPFSRDMTGEQLLSHIQSTLRFVGRGPEKAESLIRQQGIPGIRYLDGGSRGAGQGTSNYVVFPGEEGLLTILERNGQKVAK